MPLAVIARVNLFGENEPSILTFTDRHGWEIGDHSQDYEPSGNDDDSVVELISNVILGVDPTPEDDAELPGVDTDFDAEPTKVGVDSDYVSQELTEVNGLGQQDPSAAPTEEPSAEPPTEPTVETHAPSPKKGMAARNARKRKQPEKYFFQHEREQVCCCSNPDSSIVERKQACYINGSDVSETYVKGCTQEN